MNIFFVIFGIWFLISPLVFWVYSLEKRVLKLEEENEKLKRKIKDE